MSNDMVVVIFEGGYRMWSAGEAAGFPAARAAELVRARRVERGRDVGPLVHVASEREIASRAARLAEVAKPVPSRRVRFLHSVGPYAAGEMASFPEPIARKYLDGWRDRSGRKRPPVAVEPGAELVDQEERKADSIRHDLSRVSMATVRRRADAAGVAVHRGMTKDELIAAVAEAEAAGGPRVMPDDVSHTGSAGKADQ